MSALPGKLAEQKEEEKAMSKPVFKALTSVKERLWALDSEGEVWTTNCPLNESLMWIKTSDTSKFFENYDAYINRNNRNK